MSSFAIPFFKTAKLHQSFSYQGIKIWILIPQDIKTTTSTKLKRHTSSTFWPGMAIASHRNWNLIASLRF